MPKTPNTAGQEDDRRVRRRSPQALSGAKAIISRPINWRNTSSKVGVNMMNCVRRAPDRQGALVPPLAPGRVARHDPESSALPGYVLDHDWCWSAAASSSEPTDELEMEDRFGVALSSWSKGASTTSFPVCMMPTHVQTRSTSSRI